MEGVSAELSGMASIVHMQTISTVARMSVDVLVNEGTAQDDFYAASPHCIVTACGAMLRLTLLAATSKFKTVLSSTFIRMGPQMIWP